MPKHQIKANPNLIMVLFTPITYTSAQLHEKRKKYETLSLYVTRFSYDNFFENKLTFSLRQAAPANIWINKKYLKIIQYLVHYSTSNENMDSVSFFIVLLHKNMQESCNILLKYWCCK